MRWSLRHLPHFKVLPPIPERTLASTRSSLLISAAGTDVSGSFGFQTILWGWVQWTCFATSSAVCRPLRNASFTTLRNGLRSLPQPPARSGHRRRCSVVLRAHSSIDDVSHVELRLARPPGSVDPPHGIQFLPPPREDRPLPPPRRPGSSGSGSRPARSRVPGSRPPRQDRPISSDDMMAESRRCFSPGTADGLPPDLPRGPGAERPGCRGRPGRAP